MRRLTTFQYPCRRCDRSKANVNILRLHPHPLDKPVEASLLAIAEQKIAELRKTERYRKASVGFVSVLRFLSLGDRTAQSEGGAREKCSEEVRAIPEVPDYERPSTQVTFATAYLSSKMSFY